MKNLKKIYAFGTSFTEGGGFEFESPSKTELKEIYNNLNEELTIENFSYVGQLSKLLGNSIQIKNYSKSGFGNERMYRKAIDLILSTGFDKDESLLLIEFSWLGRKEFFSVAHNDYIIVNYDIRGNDGKFPINGIARTYWQDVSKGKDDIRKLPNTEFMQSFLDKTMNHDVNMKLLRNNTLMFLNFLNYHDINYIITQPPHYITPDIVDSMNLEDRYINYGNTSYMLEVGLLKDSVGSIFDETCNIISDYHFGLISSKLIASKIYDNLIERGMIEGVLLKKERTDFNHLKDIINNNCSEILNKI